jgi:glutamyl-Q tRNA(Asp) synthetase
MASWLDVRARNGRWLVRIEDLDSPREIAGAADDQVATLAAYGFRWDGPIVRQSGRGALYEAAFGHLRAGGWIYPCGCTRREVEEASSAPDANLRPGVYPGTCRHGLAGDRQPRAWRLRVPDRTIAIDDRAAGRFAQDLAHDVGDFVVRRADGLWAYQLAVVVDDAAQDITDVVRGADLLDSTPRQRLLQEALGLPHPRTLHVPLVLNVVGAKLSKGHGAIALAKDDPLPALDRAARHLGLEIQSTTSLESFWEKATAAWARRYPAPA